MLRVKPFHGNNVASHRKSIGRNPQIPNHKNQPSGTALPAEDHALPRYGITAYEIPPGGMSYASPLSGAARGKALSGARPLRCSGTPSKERFRGTVSRILSSLFTAERIIYLSSLTRVSVPFGTRSGPLLEPPIWPCTRRGFPCPGVLTPGGGLLHHLFTLTELRAYARSPAVYSLWHFPSARH